MMKKTWLTCLALLASLSLVCCTTEDSTPTESENEKVEGELVEENVTIENTTETQEGPKTSPKKMSCLPQSREEGEENRVQVLNGTSFVATLNEQLISNVTNRTIPAVCSLVLFYAPWCPFSKKAAPHFNALARHFPDLVMIAVDANRHHTFTTQFGVLALPTILLFHNAKTGFKFNQTNFELENFADFLTFFTGIEPIGDLKLRESDFEGPMPTEVVPETDIYLHISWVFVVICMLGYFSKSSFCQNVIEAIRHNWREAEIQHEHND